MQIQPFDRELSAQDIQVLRDANSVAAFFTGLGYDTATRMQQTAVNLGIAEPVQKRIKYIELLAADSDRFLQVYLFELKSVTVADIKAIARAFRDKAGNYLFVATSDYESLDFVLLDRMGKPISPTSISTASPSLIPRRFSVERRTPTPVHLRVLRRFTWTESDPFGQFDKLRFAYDLAHWSEVFFNNRGLFSDYYLSERLPSRDGKSIEFSEWREDPKPAYQHLRTIYDQPAERFAGKNTSELIEILYEPLLRELGFNLKRENSSSGPVILRLHDPQSSISLGICLPYPWGRDLDRKDDMHDTENPEATPAFAVVNLLATENVPWIVLTNGKLWRLYSKQAHSRATNYYEVDLDEVLGRQGFQQDIQDSFRYFWLLFRMQAFRPLELDWQGKRQAISLLDRLLQGSEEYAKQLGESLKSRVFTEVFPVLAEGFIANMRQHGTMDLGDEDLSAIFQGTLTLLYRLLFLLYAESRDLLPVHAREYRTASLQMLKGEIQQKAGTISEANASAAETSQERKSKIEQAFSSSDFGLWHRLKAIFTVVDQGSEELNVPRYNGGLFHSQRDSHDHSPEAEAARFLERGRIPDRYLALALDLLARDVDAKSKALVFIDYKSLGVRQLGSIYEGLLEFRLKIAKEKLAIVKEKGREVYSPFKELGEREKKRAEAQDAFVPRGRAYLENDKRERKATGSYYTPDHIVKYIVEHAVGPVLKEKFDALRPRLRQAQQERREFFKQQAEFTRRNMKPKLAEQADLIGRELVDELFNVKVLDPAMGSGHFLVETVDSITDKILEFLNAFPWNPVLVHLERMRATIQEQMDEQNIDIDANRLTDVNLLKRNVLKRCVYGVDLNPMAVELAKVSLWLDCFTLGAPLSFLDHHLRCGNSLIGSTVSEVDAIREAKGQMTLTGTSDWQGLTQAVQTMIDVGGMPDITPAQVASSKQHYELALTGVEVFKRVLNLHTARWFVQIEEPKTKKKLDIFDEMLRSGELFTWAHDQMDSPVAHTAMAKLGRDAVRLSATAAKQKRFFHWELEFPEVFYGRRIGSLNEVGRLESAGFDAVVGNPPYDVLASEELGRDVSDELNFYRTQPGLAPAIGGKMNFYKLFICKTRSLAASEGGVSLIVPMALLGDEQAAGVRKQLLETTRMESIESFPQKDDPARRVFPEAKLSTAVFHFRIGVAGSKFIVTTHPGGSLDEISGRLLIAPSEVFAFDPLNWAIPSCSQQDFDLAVRMLKTGKMRRMDQIATSYQGEVNETNEKKRGVFKDNEKLPIALRGAGVCLYAVRDASQGEELHIDVAQFLKGKREDSKAYDFRSHRIGFQRSSPQNNFRRIIAARLPDESYCLDTVSYVTRESAKVELEFILLLLNSKILDWYFRLGSTNSKVNEYQFKVLPVPTIVQTSGTKNIDLSRCDQNTLKDTLLNAYTEAGIMPEHVKDALVTLCRSIEATESKRILHTRSDRSHLAPESQHLQDIIDTVLFRYYGLSAEEHQFIEKRLKVML